MNGVASFLNDASQSKALGPVVISLVLMILFFCITYFLSVLGGGGFVLAIAIAMFISGVVSGVIFFLAFGALCFD